MDAYDLTMTIRKSDYRNKIIEISSTLYIIHIIYTYLLYIFYIIHNLLEITKLSHNTLIVAVQTKSLFIIHQNTVLINLFKFNNEMLITLTLWLIPVSSSQKNKTQKKKKKKKKKKRNNDKTQKQESLV